jgi:hypothetical protein
MGQEVSNKKFLVPGGLSTYTKELRDSRQVKKKEAALIALQLIDQYVSEFIAFREDGEWKKNKRAGKDHVMAYQIFCAAARDGNTNGLGYAVPYYTLRDYLKKKNHATVIYHIRQHRNMCQVYEKYREQNVRHMFNIAKLTNSGSERLLVMKLEALKEKRSKIQREIEYISKILNIPIE